MNTHHWEAASAPLLTENLLRDAKGQELILLLSELGGGWGQECGPEPFWMLLTLLFSAGVLCFILDSP
jgi:hypothetical protein